MRLSGVDRCFDDGNRIGDIVYCDQDIPVANGPEDRTGIGFLGHLAVNLDDHLDILPGNVQVLKGLHGLIVIFSSREYSANDLDFVGLIYGLGHRRENTPTTHLSIWGGYPIPPRQNSRFTTGHGSQFQ